MEQISITAFIALLVSGVSFAASVVAILRYALQRRSLVLDEGRREEIIEQLKEEIVEARKRIRELEERLSDYDIDLAEIKTDVKHILRSVDEIRKYINDRSGKCLG